MKLTNENVMIASLLGSQAVKQIPRFTQVENEFKEFGWYQKEIALHLGSSKTKGKKRVEVLTANYPI